MQKLGGFSDAPPVVSQSAPSNHSRIPRVDQSAVQGQTSPLLKRRSKPQSLEELQETVEKYREEMETFGR